MNDAKFDRAVQIEANRIICRNKTLKEFVDKAVEIQDKAWKIEYANRKYQFSLAVMNVVDRIATAFPEQNEIKPSEEDYARVVKANAYAIDEIEKHNRNKPELAKLKYSDLKVEQDPHGRFVVTIIFDDPEDAYYFAKDICAV